jgi:hypothetical protein
MSRYYLESIQSVNSIQITNSAVQHTQKIQTGKCDAEIKRITYMASRADMEEIYRRDRKTTPN